MSSPRSGRASAPPAEPARIRGGLPSGVHLQRAAASPDVQIIRLEEALTKLRRSYDNERSKNLELSSQLDEFRTRIAHTTVVNHVEGEMSLGARIAGLEQRLKIANEALAASETNNKSLQRENAQQKQRLQDMDRILTRLREEHESLQEKYGRSKLRLQSSLQSMDSMKLDIAASSEQYQREKTVWMEEVSSLRTYIESDQKMREVIYNRNMQREIEAAKSGNVKFGGIEEKLEMNKWKNGVKDGPRIVTLELAIDRIKQVMGVDDVDAAVRMFVASEEETQDHLVNNVRKLNTTVDSLRRDNNELRKQIEDLRNNNVAFLTKHDAKKIQKLSLQLHRAETSRESSSKELTALRKVVTSIKGGIAALCEKSGAITRADEHLNKTGINEANIMLFLGLLEERVNELVRHSQNHPKITATLGASHAVHVTADRSKTIAKQIAQIMGAGDSDNGSNSSEEKEDGTVLSDDTPSPRALKVVSRDVIVKQTIASLKARKTDAKKGGTKRRDLRPRSREQNSDESGTAESHDGMNQSRKKVTQKVPPRRKYSHQDVSRTSAPVTEDNASSVGSNHHPTNSKAASHKTPSEG